MNRNATILLAIIILAWPIISRSQNTAYYHVGFGGSLNSVWILSQNMYGQPEIDYAPKIGGNIMITGGYNFNHEMGFRLEAGYSWQGQKYKGKQYIDGINYNTTRDIKLDYFQLPIFFRYTPGDRNVKFHILAGLQLGYLVSAKQEYLRNGEKPEPFYSEAAGMVIDPGKENITDRFNSFDYALITDLGVDVKIAKFWLMSAGLRLVYGLTDINALKWQIPNHEGDSNRAENCTIGLNVGFSWWNWTKKR